MDQSTQSVVSAYPKSVISGFPLSVHQAIFDPGRSCALRVRNLLKETLMGSMAVVMGGEIAEDTLEMGFVQDQKVVEALRSDRANEPLYRRRSHSGSEKVS